MAEDNIKYTYTPVNGYILIDPEPVPSETSTGIIIPDSAKDEKPSKGTVLSVGGEFHSERGGVVPCPVSVGDFIYFKRWANQKLEEDGPYTIRFEDVIAIRRQA